jgi:hypothetical protein
MQMSSPYVTRYPTSYAQAFRRLHGRCRQSVLLHDDLTLRFVEEGVAVYYHGMRIVLFHEQTPDVTVRVSARNGKLSPKALEHIQRFLPAGYGVGQKGGVMIIREPSGHVSAGNTQTLHFTDTPI